MEVLEPPSLGYGGAMYAATLTGNYTVSDSNDPAIMSPLLLDLLPSGAERDVEFPRPGQPLEGRVQYVRNNAAAGGYTLRIRSGTSASATLGTISTLQPSESCICVYRQDPADSIWKLYTFSLGYAPTALAALALTGRVTTTDGVASGTARVVGGLAYAATAAGTLGPTGGTAETTLQSYAIPANTMKAGTVLRVRATIRATAETGATTFTGKLKIGSTPIVTVGPFDLGASDIIRLDMEITSRAAPGASAAVVVTGLATGTAAGSAVNNAIVLAPANYATNGALTLALTGQFSASDANAVASDQFLVWADG